MKHVSNFDNTPSSYIPLKSKMEYENVMEKHVKEEVVKSQKDDTLMLLNYIHKGDVEIVDNESLCDLLTCKIGINEYACKCQYGRKLKILGGSKLRMEKPPWHP